MLQLPSSEGCGWQTSAYGTFNLQSFDKDNGVSYDQVDRAIPTADSMLIRRWLRL